MDAAWAGFAERQTGRLAPGLAADFVILDQDPAQIPAADLLKLQVHSTWVDGRAVHEAQPGG